MRLASATTAQGTLILPDARYKPPGSARFVTLPPPPSTRSHVPHGEQPSAMFRAPKSVCLAASVGGTPNADPGASRAATGQRGVRAGVVRSEAPQLLGAASSRSMGRSRVTVMGQPPAARYDHNYAQRNPWVVQTASHTLAADTAG